MCHRAGNVAFTGSEVGALGSFGQRGDMVRPPFSWGLLVPQRMEHGVGWVGQSRRTSKLAIVPVQVIGAEARPGEGDKKP